MNAHEHLLCCLAEEGAEITHVVSKCLRFGVDDRNPLSPAGPTNRERLVAELNDLIAVTDLLAGKGILPKDWMDWHAQLQKKQKVATFLDYAIERGTLSLTKGE